MKTFLAIVSGFAFAGMAAASVSCYQDGTSWTDTQRLDALTLANGYCDKVGRRYFAGSEQVKECYEDYDNANLDLEMRIKNTNTDNHMLEVADCYNYFAPINSQCDKGGINDQDGWSFRLDPGTGCDGS